MTSPSRSELRLPEAVDKHFGFLESCGLSCVRRESTIVRYQSRRVLLNIYHGRRSFEIGLEIGEVGSSEPPFSASAIIRVVDPDTADRYRNFAAHTSDGVDEGVRRLAELVRPHFTNGLLDRPDLFERLERQRVLLGHALEDESKLERARAQIDSAWKARDFQRIVELLQPLVGRLTPSESRKLSYAYRHLRIPRPR